MEGSVIAVLLVRIVVWKLNKSEFVSGGGIPPLLYCYNIKKMKVSKYNIFFPYQNKVVGFNGISKDYILLEKELYELYTNGVNNVDDINEVHPEFYEYLRSKLFIIDDCIDEYDEFKGKIKKIDFDESIYELHINPTMDCNFKCWYCYETHVRNSRFDSEMVEKVKLFISNTINNNNSKIKTFSINWFGGEPLLAFKKSIIPILTYASDLCNKKGVRFFTLFTTNGLLLDEKKLKKLKEFNVEEFQITLDGHRERHDKVRFCSDKKGSYHTIVRNIISASSLGFKVSVRINFTKETFDGLENIIKDFADINQLSKDNIIFDFHQVWQDNTDLSKEKKAVADKFAKKGFKVTKSLIYSFDFTCYADKKNNANINYNGDVYKCTARDYTEDNREGILNEDGLIDWNNKYYQRLDSKFKNKACLECSILPICKSGCSQQAIEKNDTDCYMGYPDEQSKIDIVKKYFVSVFDDV